MDWVRNNRFLAGFLGVMVLGVAVLGYLLYSSYSRYSQVDAEYNTQTTELKRLQALQPYPEQDNLTKYNEQNKAFAAAVNDLQAKMAAMEPAANNATSSSEFQSGLRTKVTDIVQRARQAGLALPDNFYLGFESYRDSLPEAAAVPLLNSQLDALEKLVNILIANKVDRLVTIKRAPLEQEGSRGGYVAPTDLAAAGPAGRKPAAAAPALIARQNIELDFTAAPSSFRQALNAITKADRLYVIRALQVKNQRPDGILRGNGDPNQPPGLASAPGANPGFPPPPPPPGGNPGDQPLPQQGPPPLRYVVGQEKLDVMSRIELVKVAPPAPSR